MTKLVYLIKADNIYKIGVTTNLQQRLKVIERRIKKSVQVTHTFGGWTMAEKTMHLFYADKRIVGGEWFNLTDEDVEKIKTIQNHCDAIKAFHIPSQR